jgi:hypothetical protein
MMPATSTNFFKKNGRHLKGLMRRKEAVTTLFQEPVLETTTTLFEEPSPKYKSILDLKIAAQKYCSKTKPYITETLITIRAQANNLKRYDLATTWVTGSVALFALFAIGLLLFPTKINPKTEDRYAIYSSKPLTLDSNVMGIYTRDSRAQRINEVMREYNCPMEGLGEVFVAEADKNNIPWWLVASIAFQESSCGKHMPTLDGANSFNSWGWGVYGDNVYVFDNWVRGIETVSEYMNEMFFSKGVTEPCEIMATYTPPSQGSWCEGVKYFGDQFQNYKTPTE